MESGYPQIKAKTLIVESEGHFGNFWIWAKIPESK
jgi:hypothetical protein